MSVKSFMEEYCPITDAGHPDYDGTVLGAAKHSLRKWSGINDPVVIKNHGLSKKVYGRVMPAVYADSGGNRVSLTTRTCALCHINTDDVWSVPDCEKCVLQMHCGFDCCHPDSPYVKAMYGGKTDVLVEALQAVVDKLEAQ